jgi:hypothetical protein
MLTPNQSGYNLVPQRSLPSCALASNVTSRPTNTTRIPSDSYRCCSSQTPQHKTAQQQSASLSYFADIEQQTRSILSSHTSQSTTPTESTQHQDANHSLQTYQTLLDEWYRIYARNYDTMITASISESASRLLDNQASLNNQGDGATNAIDQSSQHNHLETLYALFVAWYKLAQGTQASRVSCPFQQTLTILSCSEPIKTSSSVKSSSLQSVLATRPLSPLATCALQVLHDWRDALEGDLEHGPTRQDYERVLYAYAHESLPMPHAYPSHGSIDTQAHDSPPAGDHAADLAREVVTQLSQWGYTMKPTLQTYAYAAACLKQTVQYHCGPVHYSKAPLHHSTAYQEEQAMQDPHVHHESDSSLQDLPWKDWAQDWHNYVQAVCTMPNDRPGSDGNDNSSRSSNNQQSHIAWKSVCELLQSGVYFTQKAPHVTLNEKSMHLLLMTYINQFPDFEASVSTNNSGVDNKLLSSIARTVVDSSLINLQQILLHWPMQSGGETSHLIAPIRTQVAIDALKMVQRQGKSLDLPRVSHYIRTIQIALQDANSDSARVFLRECLRKAVKRLDSISQQAHEPDMPMRFEPQQAHAWNELLDVCWSLQDYDSGIQVWQRMNSLKVYRDTRSVSLILKILANSAATNPNAAPMAHSIWRKSHLQSSWKPTAQQAASVMVAWSKSRHPDAVRQCESIMAELKSTERYSPEDVSAIHYAALITAHGKSSHPGATDHVMHAYQVMKSRYTGQLTPPAYISVLAALARRHQISAANEAQSILDELEEEWLENYRHDSVAASLHLDDQYDNQGDLPPDIRCYTSVMNAWVWSSAEDAVDKCEALVQRLQHVWQKFDHHPNWRPNSYVYRILIEAWQRSSRVDAIEQAEKVLQRMEEEAAHKRADLPDKTVYTALLHLWLKRRDSRAVEKAMGLLEKMNTAYSSGNLSAKPDNQTMATVMLIVARSDDLYKARRCQDLLQSMCLAYEQGEVDMRPNAYVFSALLNACVFTDRSNEAARQQAAQIAISTMNKLEELGLHDCLNSVTYNYLFRVLGQLIVNSNDRARLADALFQSKLLLLLLLLDWLW